MSKPTDTLSRYEALLGAARDAFDAYRDADRFEDMQNSMAALREAIRTSGLDFDKAVSNG